MVKLGEIGVVKLREILHVDSKDIRKHRNDILRIAQILGASVKLSLGKLASSDIQNILSEIESNVSAKDIKNLLSGTGLSKVDLLSVLKKAFQLTV